MRFFRNLLLLGLVGAGAWFWFVFRPGPVYALWQVREAVKDKDRAALDKYLAAGRGG